MRWRIGAGAAAAMIAGVAPGLLRTGSVRNAWFKGNADYRAARQVVKATRRGLAEAEFHQAL